MLERAPPQASVPLSSLCPLVSSLERKLRGGTVAWVWPILFETCLPNASLCPSSPSCGTSRTTATPSSFPVGPATSSSSPRLNSLNCLCPSCKPDQEARTQQGKLMVGRGCHCAWCYSRVSTLPLERPYPFLIWGPTAPNMWLGQLAVCGRASLDRRCRLRPHPGCVQTQGSPQWRVLHTVQPTYVGSGGRLSEFKP